MIFAVLVVFYSRFMADQKSSRVATNLAYRVRKMQVRAPAKLAQRSSFFIPAFQLEHHAFDVSVILVPLQEL
jgi:hypothetical protein